MVLTITAEEGRRNVAAHGSSHSQVRDPRDIPFRTTPKDPSVTSSSYSSRRHPSQSPSSVRNGGRGSVRSRSPESKGSTVGRSTISSISITAGGGDLSVASTCSAITKDASFRMRQHGRRRNDSNNGKRRPFSLSWIRYARETTREGEIRKKNRDRVPHLTIWTYVNVPQKVYEDTIVLIANMPRDIRKEDRDCVRSVENRRSETNDHVVSRRWEEQR